MIERPRSDWRRPVEAVLKRAVTAGKTTDVLSSKQKEKVLLEAADELERRSADVLKQNAKDLAGSRREGLAEPMIERLTLDRSSWST